MKVTWLGGAGLSFENDRVRVFVNCAQEGADVLLFTGACHLSADALASVLEKSPETLVLACRSAFDTLAELSEKYNTIPIAAHSVYSEKNVTFYAVHAEGVEGVSDPVRLVSQPADFGVKTVRALVGKHAILFAGFGSKCRPLALLLGRLPLCWLFRRRFRIGFGCYLSCDIRAYCQSQISPADEGDESGSAPL